MWAEFIYMYDALLVKLFWWCVEILDDIANASGLTYEELNIYVFIILHPAITLFFAVKWWRCKRAHKQHVQELFHRFGIYGPQETGGKSRG
jgi:hypothetical protein